MEWLQNMTEGVMNKIILEKLVYVARQIQLVYDMDSTGSLDEVNTITAPFAALIQNQTVNAY